jgi:hypothetical protein
MLRDLLFYCPFCDDKVVLIFGVVITNAINMKAKAIQPVRTPLVIK